MAKSVKEKKEMKIFSSFDEENEEEYKRRQQMSCEERCREFSILQERRWGKYWRSKPIKKVVTYD